MRSLTMPEKHYQLNGYCVYCRKHFSEGLTDEHIIPRALNGSFIIDLGACEPCARHSNQMYEQPALNNDLLVPRRILGLRTRNRGKKYNSKIPLPPISMVNSLQTPGTEDFDTYLPGEEYPNSFQLIHFPPAGRLVNIERTGEITEIRLQMFSLGYDPKRPLQSTTRHIHINGPFAMMIAKIAYCLAVAEKGFEAFNGSDIRDLLAGKRDDVYNFVGGVIAPEALTKRHIHGLYFRNRGHWLTVLVDLFASLRGEQVKAAPYEVVVGQRS